MLSHDPDRHQRAAASSVPDLQDSAEPAPEDQRHADPARHADGTHPHAPVDPQFRRARLRMLLAVMLCYVFFYTGRQAFGFAMPGIQQEFGLTKTQLGWCSAAMLWAYAIGQAINGQLADRFGGRSMMTIGAFLSCGLNWLVSFSIGPATIAIPWTLNGFAQSMGWAPGSRILSNWWDKSHRGIVYGCYVFAAGSSSVVTYLMSAVVLDYGWRWIFRLPVLCLFTSAAAFWFIARNRPSELGFENIPPDAGEPEAAPEESAWRRYRIALTNARFLLASISIGFQNVARYGLLVWVPVHFLGANWKESPEKWISVALPVGMAFGAVANGWFSDRIIKGSRGLAICIFLFFATLTASAMWFLPRGHALVIPVLFLTGFFVYGPQAGYWALCPDLLGRRLAGTGTGVMNCFAYTFAGFGEPLIGHLIGANVFHAAEPTAIVFLVVAASSAISMLFVLIARC